MLRRLNSILNDLNEWLKGSVHQNYKSIFSHLPLGISSHTDSFSFICPGFEILYLFFDISASAKFKMEVNRISERVLEAVSFKTVRFVDYQSNQDIISLKTH